MMLAFVLIAGSLAAGAAVLLLLPLVRQREDARPGRGSRGRRRVAGAVVRRRGLYAAFSNYSWVDAPRRGRHAGGHGRETREAAGRRTRRSRRAGSCSAAPTARSSSSRSRCAPINAPIAWPMGRMPKPSSASPNRCSRRTSSSCAAPRDICSSARCVLEPDNPEGVALQRVRRAEPRRERRARASDSQRMLTLQSAAADSRHHRKAAARARWRAGAAAPECGSGRSGREGCGARHSGAVAGGEGAGGRDAVRRGARSEGSGPAVRGQAAAGAFPVDVELSAADAMLETRRIAAGQQLEVVARVALGGTPTATSGDPFGQVSYHVGKDGRLNIVIDRLAP